MNKPYIKQYDLDLNVDNPNFGVPIILNPITKEQPFHNTTRLNRRARRSPIFINAKGEPQLKVLCNNRKETKGRKLFRQLVYSNVNGN